MANLPIVRGIHAFEETRRECPLCSSHHLEYEFVIEKSPVCSCTSCGLLFRNPVPTSPTLDVSESHPPILDHLYSLEAEERIRQFISYSRITTGDLLFIGSDQKLVDEARKAGFSIVALAPEEFETTSIPGTPHFAACILLGAIDRFREPVSSLSRIRQMLRPGGSMMVVSPTLDSEARRRVGSGWWAFHRNSLFYFSVDTLQNVLFKSGFGKPYIAADRSPTQLKYLKGPRTRKAIGSGRRLRVAHSAWSRLPMFGPRRFSALPGRTCIFTQVVESNPKPRLSVIVPVFNEEATCAELLDQLVSKTIDGVDIELIIVESNSSDGSREIVRSYEDHPRVKILLEDRPSGKGHAVRTGLKAATGDVVLFQDADLEYDLNDYEGLIRPILRYQRNFVLGSRHSQNETSWKIRQFSDAPGLAGVFNFGHLIFLTLFNLLYSQKLTDPFTMFKVFRRECLFGLKFECNRFDFDYEIVIKLLRKGYQPQEIGVNYVSRSIQEGKKVTMFRDPLTWIRALLKFRRAPLYERPL